MTKKISDGFCSCGNPLPTFELFGRTRFRGCCDACLERLRAAKQAAKQAKQKVQQAEEARLNRIRKKTGLQARLKIIPPLYRKAHLRDLNPRLVDQLLGAESGAFLWGSVGTGKTYALAAVLRKFAVAGFECKRISFDRLCLEIRGTFSSASYKSESNIINRYIESDYLFFEDLSTGGKSESDFNLRTLLVLLDTRMEYCRPTYISSNKSVEQIGQAFDGRILSRLHKYRIIKLSGRDKRRQQH